MPGLATRERAWSHPGRPGFNSSATLVQTNVWLSTELITKGKLATARACFACFTIPRKNKGMLLQCNTNRTQVNSNSGQFLVIQTCALLVFVLWSFQGLHPLPTVYQVLTVMSLTCALLFGASYLRLSPLKLYCLVHCRSATKHKLTVSIQERLSLCIR